MEAKRRLAAGEFPALHDAQLAIAWEHGQPSWTALKQRISQAADVRLWQVPPPPLTSGAPAAMTAQPALAVLGVLASASLPGT